MTGTVASGPAFIDALAGEASNERYTGRHYRMVPTVTGLEAMYWIELDEERLDADGDGPYAQGEFLSSFLEAVEQD